ncbi:hypothetical protein P8605_33100 [Streptomyces sp. T-3]|nr:hypothetical protein [Streptomyces sp. T-3]
MGGATGTAVYHRRALLHVLDDAEMLRNNGQTSTNLAAWALACAWRGMELRYSLSGPIVVTGSDGGDTASLDEELAGQVHRVAQTVRETLDGWRSRPPVTNETGLTELLAYVRRDLRLAA